MFAYGDLLRIPQADFEVGGRRYGVYGHNWRATPPLAWLAGLARQELGGAPPASEIVSPAPAAQPAMHVALSRDAFAAAVREALRDYCRPDQLGGNALLSSRIVVERHAAHAALAERIEALQACLRAAADALQRSPREVRLYRAVYHTYFQPATTQHAAAELLDLPFSTYRRHLTAGVARLTEILWQWELQGLVR
jgi:hypothetical protein